MPERQPFLARLIGPERYWRILLVFHERPALVLLVASIPFAVVFAWLYWAAGRWSPTETTHDAFLQARVLFSEHLASDDTPPGTRFHIELPDGTRIAVKTYDLSRAMNVIDTACIERRIPSKGAPHYILAWPKDCEAPAPSSF